ncbi:MAG: hypothetical protein K2X55_15730 [Burkholderiaceae bacterium]|nr:hypothetical protein [Burkholderiaceae bacterium]
MGIRDALLKTVNEMNGGWSVAAAYLGMSEAVLRSRIYESKGWQLATRDAISLQQFADVSYFAEAVASECGETFIRLPAVDAIESESIHLTFNQYFADLGLLWTEFSGAVANDGKIDDNEREKLQAMGEALHRKTEMLLALMFSVYCPRTNAVKMPAMREVANG